MSDAQTASIKRMIPNKMRFKYCPRVRILCSWHILFILITARKRHDFCWINRLSDFFSCHHVYIYSFWCWLLVAILNLQPWPCRQFIIQMNHVSHVDSLNSNWCLWIETSEIIKNDTHDKRSKRTPRHRQCDIHCNPAAKSYCSYWFMRMIYWFFALIYMRHQHHHSLWLTCSSFDRIQFPCKRMHSNRVLKFNCWMVYPRLQPMQTRKIAKGNIFHLNNYDVCSVHIVNLCDFNSHSNWIEASGMLNSRKGINHGWTEAFAQTKCRLYLGGLIEYWIKWSENVSVCCITKSLTGWTAFWW